MEQHAEELRFSQKLVKETDSIAKHMSLLAPDEDQRDPLGGGRFEVLRIR